MDTGADPATAASAIDNAILCAVVDNVLGKPWNRLLAAQPQFILVIIVMDNVAVPTEPSPPQVDFRFAAGVILLLPVIWFTWLTVDGLAARRQLRSDLAELTHVRYGLCS